MSTCIKRRTFINLVIDTYVERVLQTAFKINVVLVTFIKINKSDRHDTDSENHTVVRKMRSAVLYSTARYSLYSEQYIRGVCNKSFYFCAVKSNLINGGARISYCITFHKFFKKWE